MSALNITSSLFEDMRILFSVANHPSLPFYLRSSESSEHPGEKTLSLETASAGAQLISQCCGSAHGEGSLAFMLHSLLLGTFLLLPITPYAGSLKSQCFRPTVVEPYRNHLCSTDCSHPISTLRPP